VTTVDVAPPAVAVICPTGLVAMPVAFVLLSVVGVTTVWVVWRREAFARVLSEFKHHLVERSQICYADPVNLME
jgi:hypothetical protein